MSRHLAAVLPLSWLLGLVTVMAPASAAAAPAPPDEHDLRWAKRHLGIRVNTGRPSTLDELREMVTTTGLSIIRLEDRIN